MKNLATKFLITEAGITYTELAAKIGISRQWLYILLNKRDLMPDMLMNISNAVESILEERRNTHEEK